VFSSALMLSDPEQQETETTENMAIENIYWKY
jgi:hypothetical protein